VNTFRELAITFHAYDEAIAKAREDLPRAASQLRLELEDADVPKVVQALRLAAEVERVSQAQDPMAPWCLALLKRTAGAS